MDFTATVRPLSRFGIESLGYVCRIAASIVQAGTGVLGLSSGDDGRPVICLLPCEGYGGDETWPEAGLPGSRRGLGSRQASGAAPRRRRRGKICARRRLLDNPRPQRLLRRLAQRRARRSGRARPSLPPNLPVPSGVATILSRPNGWQPSLNT